MPEPAGRRTKNTGDNDAREYSVDSTEIVRSEEMRGLDPIDDIILTLVTCYPLEYVGTAPDRFIEPASRPSP